MIDFRYHVVSIVAVFLALGIGIIVGTTTLNGPILDDLQGKTTNLAKNNTSLQSRLDDLSDQVTADRAFDTALLPYAVQGRLTGQTVALVSGPGVGSDLRRDVTAALRAAGATVTSDVQLRPAFADPDQDATLAALAGKLAGDAGLPAGSGVQQAATQLASVLLTAPQAPANPPGALRTSLDAYSQAQLVTVHGSSPRTAGVAVVLADNAPGDSTQARAVADALLTLTTALDAHGKGAVLAGTAAAAGGDGALTRAARDAGFGDHASSVPQADQPAGRIALVFALQQQLDGHAATFSTPADAVNAAPSPSPSP